MGKTRILLFEENSDLRNNLQDLLLYEGYQVQVADTPTKTLFVVEAFKPDIVICCVEKPHLGGIAVAVVLSIRFGILSERIIFVTAIDLYNHYFPASYNNVLLKPFAFTTLQQKIEKQLNCK